MAPGSTAPHCGVSTWTVPPVAPDGTVAEMAVGERMAKVAGLPLKVTLAAPVSSVPKAVGIEKDA